MMIQCRVFNSRGGGLVGRGGLHRRRLLACMLFALFYDLFKSNIRERASKRCIVGEEGLVK